MDDLEVCQIVRRAHQSGWSMGAMWWEARQATSQGEVIIARSDEFSAPWEDRGWLADFLGDITFVSLFTGRGDRDTLALRERSRAAHAQVVGQLVAQGWEPAGTDDQGLVSVMRRERRRGQPPATMPEEV